MSDRVPLSPCRSCVHLGVPWALPLGAEVAQLPGCPVTMLLAKGILLRDNKNHRGWLLEVLMENCILLKELGSKNIIYLPYKKYNGLIFFFPNRMHLESTKRST